MLLAACGTDAESSTSGARGLKVAVAVAPSSLDPYLTSSPNVNAVVQNIAEPLFRRSIDDFTKVEPWLATDFQVSADGLSVTLPIRKEVTFHDGTPLDAEAVKYNIDRWLETPTFYSSYIRAIENVTVVDDLTVQLTLSAADPVLKTALTSAGFMILSPKSFTSLGNSSKSYVHPVGTGPFAFEKYEAGSSLSMKQFSDYWGGRSYYSTITYQYVSDANTRESLLLSGQVDLIRDPPITDLTSLASNSAVRVTTSAGQAGSSLLYLHTQRAPLDDVRVRQALNYAIDKDALAKAIYGDLAVPAYRTGVPSVLANCEQEQEGYPFDPDKARQLLSEAGVSDLTLKFASVQGAFLGSDEVATALTGMLGAVGVKIDLENPTATNYSAGQLVKPSDAAWDLVLTNRSMTLDSYDFLRFFTSSELPPDGRDGTFMSNAEYDAKVEQIGKAANIADRSSLSCEGEKALLTEAPLLFLFSVNGVLVSRADVRGVVMQPDLQLRVTQLTEQ
ncbi:ABC transporter substrate-binding protein [Acrocarpospora pleiomorpha]|uniref:ABC transporter substrate-binding protein n=1 Tax=Acrocarpospora pleiomorpha TaxID=90975 RepID=UPI001C3F5339|nr:ABC transporter substrate-binding protein [Acrocarpospora pleiomorpha]